MTRGRVIQITAAYALDALIGDPTGYPHPVRIMGRWIELLERGARRRGSGRRREGREGVRLAALVAGCTYLLTRALVALPGGKVTGTLLLYTTIARRDLARSSLLVADAVESGDIEEARRLLGSLVGRDVDGLDAPAISRAVVESVAENYVDGVLSPLLWAAIGGAPGAMAFKAVSTLDSMLGHRDERYMDLGRCSARMDDLANFPAARLSIPLISAAALLCGYDATGAFTVGVRDRMNHESPNSAHPEAAFAGALELGLGGPCMYGGTVRELPAIGSGTRAVGPAHIRRAVGLMNAASVLAIAITLACAWRWR